MNPTIKAKWIERLRDPNVLQCRRRLHSRNADGADCYCATGVLGQLYAEAHGCSWTGEDNPQDDQLYEHGVLPAQVLSWAGLSAMRNSWVISWNDYDHHTLPEIATLIESNF